MVKRDKLGNPKSWRQFYAHHWEISPILAICTMAVIGYATVSVYFLCSRPDVAWYRGQTEQHAEALAHPHVSKFLKVHGEYPPNNELADLYRDMEKKQKEREDEQKKK